MNATTIILVCDGLYWPVAGALFTLYIAGRHPVANKPPTEKSQALLQQAAADYHSPAAHKIRQNLGWDPKDETLAVQFDTDGLLRDGSDGAQ